LRLVAKFGGTSLGSGERIDRAADSIAAVVEDGHEVLVVASAMGSSTDDLLSEITFEASEADQAEIVSMGERTSVRMLKAALTARGVPAVFIEPGHPDWPIVVDEHGEVAEAYGVGSLSTEVIVAPDGTIVHTETGVADHDRVVRVLTSLLADGDGAASSGAPP
jgi:aspartate kinase